MKPRRFALALSLAWTLAGSVCVVSLGAATTAACPAAGAKCLPDTPAIVFYTDSAASATFWPPFFAALHHELAQANPANQLPASARLIVAGDQSVDPGVSNVIVVHLEGRCDQPRQAWRPLAPGAALGWVYKSPGRIQPRIQPFVFVDCARIAQLLDPVTLGMSDDLRVEAMDTAIARVLLHEWIHISLQTADHTEHGIRQPRLTARDLTAIDDLRASREPEP